MAPSTRIPKSLYKYRAFSALTVESLVSDKVFFADPSTFNDPLDTKPVVTAAGMAIDLLEKTVADLLQRRLRDEMLAAARSISYRGPKTTEHIDRLGEKYVRRELADIAYHATNPDYEAPLDESHRALLAHRLQIELLKRYDRGILSLAERNSCPLMWSHYGDQHRGLCIGYGVPQPLPAGLYPVHYGRSRLVDASLVAKMLDDDPVARSHVDAAVFLGKASPLRH